MGKISYSRLDQNGYSPRLVNSSGLYIPFANECFHQVVATFPAEYILNENTISEIYRVLEPGGEFIVLPTAWLTGKNWYHRVNRWLWNSIHKNTELNTQLMDSLKKKGFRLTFGYEEYKISKVLLIQSRKI